MIVTSLPRDWISKFSCTHPTVNVHFNIEFFRCVAEQERAFDLVCSRSLSEFSFLIAYRTVCTMKAATLAQHVRGYRHPFMTRVIWPTQSNACSNWREHDVAMVGAGQTKFGNHPLGLKGMWSEAMEKAIQCRSRLSIRRCWWGIYRKHCFRWFTVGKHCSFTHRDSEWKASVRRVGLASSGFALRDAWMAIKSGQADVVVAGGIGKWTTYLLKETLLARVRWHRMNAWQAWPSGTIAARRYFHEFDSTHDDLVYVSVKDMHDLRTKSHIYEKSLIEKQNQDSWLQTPNTHDCCPHPMVSAVILVADHLAHKYTDTPVADQGSGAGSDHLALHDRPSITQLRATQPLQQRPTRPQVSQHQTST